MNRRQSKAQKRAELLAEVERFLQSGGSVESVAQGVSGRDDPEKALIPALFTEKAMSRTDVSKALQCVDMRKKKAKAPTKIHRRPKKKPVYDDFGELLRWVWEE